MKCMPVPKKFTNFKMIRKDFIQRYLDELTKVIARVLQFKQNNEPEKANYELDEFGKNFLSINLNEIIGIQPGELIKTLITIYQFDLTRFKLLEDLLYHKYLLNTSDKRLKNCTLEVLNYLTANDVDYSFERMNRIDELTY